MRGSVVIVPQSPSSFVPRLALTPSRFAFTAPASGCSGDVPPDVGEHAAHTTPLAVRSTPTAVFLMCVVLLTLAALWPIWSVRILPMQDYPQHLFVSQILNTYNDPSFDWRIHYETDLGLRPYMLWYVLMVPLARVCGVETGGKLIFSLYIVSIAVLVLCAARRRKVLPWGALLLYPFAFNQFYFMGFANYVLSMPLLFIALMDLEELARRGASLRRALWHGVYLAALFLNHPFTVLVYGGLTVPIAVSALQRRHEFRRAITPAIVLGIVFVLWFVVAQPGPRDRTTAVWALRWWPFPGPLEYYALMFTGLRWTSGPDLVTAGVWAGIAGIFVDACWRYRPQLEALRWPLVALVASLLGFCVLPFWAGYWSYFNLRLAPVTYFALALVLGRIHLPWKRGTVAAILVMVLMLVSVRLQARVSQEVQDVLPVLQVMRPNALVLPLVFDGTPQALDPVFFYEFHSHEAAYYHLIVGGGAGPDDEKIWGGLLPVHHRPDFRPPAPAEPGEFSWNTYGAHYDYIIVRAAPPELIRYLSDYCDVVARSGAWMLFQNRAVPLPSVPAASTQEPVPRS